MGSYMFVMSLTSEFKLRMFLLLFVSLNDSCLSKN